MTKIYHYFVEGECEKKFINELKVPKTDLILPGKVEVLNVVCEKISRQRLMVLNPKTNIILVYDIDVENTEILDYNLELLREFKFKNIYHIQSIHNFEEELVYATSLKTIHEMYQTVSIDEFKSKFIHQNNLFSKLKKMNYDNSKMWSRVNDEKPFSKYSRKKDLTIIKK